MVTKETNSVETLFCPGRVFLTEDLCLIWSPTGQWYGGRLWAFRQVVLNYMNGNFTFLNAKVNTDGWQHVFYLGSSEKVVLLWSL